jgi:hypothetical protein
MESASARIRAIDRIGDISDEVADACQITAATVHINGSDLARVTGKISFELAKTAAAELIRAGHDHLIIHLGCQRMVESPGSEFECTLHVGKTFSQCYFFSTDRRAHAFFVPLWLLSEVGPGEPIRLDVENIVKMDQEADAIPFEVRVLVGNKEKIYQSVEDSLVFVLSTARSGSTWLASDILGWRSLRRLLDEPGFGGFFAPLDWSAERFFDLPNVPYMESGLEYELGLKSRLFEVAGSLPLAPFHRRNADCINEDGFFNKWYRKDFYRSVRHFIVEFVVNEWGILDYRQVVL